MKRKIKWAIGSHGKMSVKTVCVCVRACVFIGLMSNVASWDRGFGPLKSLSGFFITGETAPVSPQYRELPGDKSSVASSGHLP